MNGPILFPSREVAPDTHLLGAYLPVSRYGVLAINAFALQCREPVLIDTGLAALRGDFMSALRSLMDPAELRWIWLTHADPDHLGSLAAVLEAAPRARMVTNFVGMAKLGLLGLPVERVHLVNPGQTLTVGDRDLLAVHPPCFDAPETMAVLDRSTRTLFSSDCFGGLLNEPAPAANEVDPKRLRQGMATWATIDAPWLHLVGESRFRATLDAISALSPLNILSSHLPPAQGMTDTLLNNLDSAREAPVFVGPDQAELQRMMAA